MRYRCRIGARELELDVDADGGVRVDGAPLEADVARIGPLVWSVILAGRSHEIAVLEREPLRVRLDGRDVVVDVADERERAAIGRAGGDTRPYEVRAPMPGLIVAVHVREGEVVEAGGSVCTLEAMKMENELTVPRRGRVATLRAAAGAKVNGGDLLAVIAAE
ncbi:MAG TPA: biotin/lipoyl-containing protein [Candidatus Dormibacteraeota bacterium]|nr:biotin/lipoyl-containing protein [Candidatus Dormibacteraeota bacterium]